MTGNYILAWRNFKEIVSKNVIGDQLHNKIFMDIVLNKPLFRDTTDERQNNRNLCQYLQFVSSKADLKRYGSLIVHAYADLSENLLEHDDYEQAIECLVSEIEVRQKIIQYDKSERLELAHRSMDLAELCGEKNSMMAIKYYKQAITRYERFKNVGVRDRMAVCWCEIGSLRPKHNATTFINAFDLLLPAPSNRLRMIITTNIAQCYSCLAKSDARCPELSFLALDISIISLRLCINDTTDDLILSDEDLDDCWEWTLSLYQIKSGEFRNIKLGF